MNIRKYKKISVLLFLAAGCCVLIYFSPRVFTSRDPYVDFSEHREAIQTDKYAPSSPSALRVAVATMWSVESTFSRYRSLVAKIGHDVGLKESMVLRPSYNALRQAIENHEVDVAIVCTGPYVYLLKGGSVNLLVQPQFANGQKYHAVILAPVGSSISRVEDLKGLSMGFSDLESFTGYLVPYVMMTERGMNPHTFLKKIVFTGSHDRSIRAVDTGIVQAAAVHSIVWESAKREDPGLNARLKVIWSSEPYGPPPVIVSTSLSDSLTHSLREAFLHLDKDPESRSLLLSIGIERFVPPREDVYASAIDLYTRYIRLGDGK
jgi:phosphonate transport system substrate-binding protein